MKKCIVVLAALGALAVFLAACSKKDGAAAYPTKPVTCIIPYAPGGGSDTLTRAVMKAVKLPGGQPLVGVNTEGAAGYTGAVRTFNSPPDGYTIMTHNTMDILAYFESGQDNIPLWSELTTIALVVSDYNLVCTNKTAAAKYGWKSIEDVVAWVKANPAEKLRWGTVGAQTVNMVDTKRIARALGIENSIIFVPYDGGANSRTAALANEIQLETCTASEIPGVVASGDNIPLMVVNDTRIASNPDVPTTVEKGVNVTTAKPRGYFGPKGMKESDVKVLSDALRLVCEDAEFQSVIKKLGFDINFVDGPAAVARTKAWVAELQPFFDEFKQQ
ncbi:MAG: tripartite tricarboxylate transporter substrate binding protein [Spirochaetaceae bacterium]|jgi:tripartite-type tricarboxylate transporter receptor subunit TctC|nr:tripartite tricarboxylate transporter substrate binding protein [Spirochaetaceae bacterium]